MDKINFKSSQNFLWIFSLMWTGDKMMTSCRTIWTANTSFDETLQRKLFFVSVDRLALTFLNAEYGCYFFSRGVSIRLFIRRISLTVKGLSRFVLKIAFVGKNFRKCRQLYFRLNGGIMNAPFKYNLLDGCFKRNCIKTRKKIESERNIQ